MVPESKWKHRRLLGLKPEIQHRHISFPSHSVGQSNHMAEPQVKKWGVPSPTVKNTAEVNRNRVGQGVRGNLSEMCQAVILPVGFSSLSDSDLKASFLPSPDDHGNQMSPWGVIDTECCFSPCPTLFPLSCAIVSSREGTLSPSSCLTKEDILVK